jgi:hypothetical protein
VPCFYYDVLVKEGEVRGELVKEIAEDLLELDCEFDFFVGSERGSFSGLKNDAA